MNPTRKILITGAGGRIGLALIPYLNDKYSLTLGDINTSKLQKWVHDGHELVDLDIRDIESCRQACKGIDTVIHLAGDPSPHASFESVLKVNIEGTYNIFKAAQEESCSRVVFASSAQVVEGYPIDTQVQPDMPVRPKNLYGVGKSFGEALASYFAYQENLPSIAIRIGAFDEVSQVGTDLTARDMSAYISPEDMCHLIEQCVITPLQKPFEIVHAVSNNRFKRLDISKTKEVLDYSPQHDGFQKCGFIFKG
ncbi:NAD-dependent epimerase/dehydratase family protein [Paenibacillus sp. RC84]|uniref:NAD-dependent epimerase/dehydratase family protein n=1 Tax=Paenibacillus sp. RC84 TaxID=3156252 RepID=UPI00351168CE